MIFQSLKTNDIQIRAVSPQTTLETNDDLQRWNADHLGFRWGQAQRINEKFFAGEISAEEWLELYDAMLLEGHANAWWIGRGFAGDNSDFNDDDLFIGRGYRDADADYLLKFYNDVMIGVYSDEDGNPKKRMMHSRSRLYIGKLRGTTNEAFVDGSSESALFYWRLGGNEEHCTECPSFVDIFDGVTKDTMFTTPGAGDTPCLGNCLCHLESVANSMSQVGPLAVSLPYEDDDLNQIAA